jgi:ADP-ribosylglycohydrolase
LSDQSGGHEVTLPQELSALWAAYGDAIGFITEMRDAEGLRRKISAARVTRPVPWARRVGGRFGPSANLPEGCYSDDTQLRLATGRAIRGDGTFDVEAFAKVELPVWLSYYLGAGRGTTAAAHNLERKDVAWYTNFYEVKSAQYLKSGGNGAAMRIQPHVWADRAGVGSKYRLDVLRNALTTHGHPRGFLGALFHADCLAYTKENGQVPGPDAWMAICQTFMETTALIGADDYLERVWLPTWEASARASLRDVMRQTQEEHEHDIRLVTTLLASGRPDAVYRDVLKQLGGLASATAGSGTKTALLSAVLAYLFREESTETALVTAANQFGSDTDTIASMTGALRGLVEHASPPVAPADAEYIVREANRLGQIGRSNRQPSFRYPDLLHWRVPKTAVEFVGLAGNDTVLAGLGRVTPLSEPISQAKSEGFAWQWFRLDFGQSVLAKRRLELPQIPEYAWPAVQGGVSSPDTVNAADESALTSRPDSGWIRNEAQHMSQPNLFEGGPREAERVYVVRRRLNDLTTEVIRSGFDPEVLGRNLRWILDHSRNTIEAAVAFVAIIAKARASGRDAGRDG